MPRMQLISAALGAASAGAASVELAAMRCARCGRSIHPGRDLDPACTTLRDYAYVRVRVVVGPQPSFIPRGSPPRREA